MTYGIDAKVGNLMCFSREGAIEKYKIYCKMFNDNPCMETSSVCSDAMLDMLNLGFSLDELEQIESEVK